MQNLETLAALAAELPKEVKDNALTLVERMGEVIEGLGDRPIEWRPETLKLVQGTSDRGKLPKGANIGSIILGEDIMEQPVKVIPLRVYTTRQYWNPDPEQAQMLCSSPDGEVGYRYGNCRLCPFSKFDTENNRSQCNKTLTVLSVTADLKRAFFSNFSKTNYANGTDWQKLMRTAGVAPYKRFYELSSETSKKSKNVESLKAEPVPQGKVEGPLLNFVEELFKVSGDDRKESLKRFYEIVEANKANSGNQLAAPDAATVELLPAVEVEEEVAKVDEVASAKASAAKEAGQKYKL